MSEKNRVEVEENTTEFSRRGFVKLLGGSAAAALIGATQAQKVNASPSAPGEGAEQIYQSKPDMKRLKNATIVLGSPHTNGNTARLVEAMLSVIDNKDILIKKIELSKLKKINHCMGCNSCRNNDVRKCVFDDGLNDVIAEVRNSDLLVIASPIYFFNLNSLTKAFIDRLFYSSEISNNENILRGKKIAIILTYGLANVIESGAKNALQSLYDISKFVGLQVIGIVYGSIGDDQEQNELLLNRAKSLGKIINKEISA